MKKIHLRTPCRFGASPDADGNEQSLDAVHLEPLPKELVRATAALTSFREKLTKYAPEESAIIEKAAAGGSIDELTVKLQLVRSGQELTRARIQRLGEETLTALVAHLRVATKTWEDNVARLTVAWRDERDGKKAEAADEFGPREASRLSLYGLKSKSVRNAERELRDAQAVYGTLEALLLAVDAERWGATLAAMNTKGTRILRPDFQANGAKLLEQLAS